MSRQIRSWQIVDGSLVAIETSLAEQNRREAEHLETWIESAPEILGPEIVLIGRQVNTLSGPLDLLGIDRSGNIVIVELKRDRLPREALCQAIDYASDIASWSVDRLSEECISYSSRSLPEIISENFEDVDLESLLINASQRILLVGFSVDENLERMIKWLTSSSDVEVNAIVLNYSRTSSGDELLTRGVIVSEEEERSRGNRRRFKFPMSDEPGTYEPGELKDLVSGYLSSGLYSAERIRNVLLPACLKNGQVARDQLLEGIVASGETADPATAGRFASLISREMGTASKDYLRQIIGYDYPEHHWQKDNYHIRDGYRPLVEEVLAELEGNS